MMKRWEKRILLLAASAVLTAGCAKTPEDAIVRKKGTQSLENYQEADPKGTQAESTQDVGNDAGENGADDAVGSGSDGSAVDAAGDIGVSLGAADGNAGGTGDADNTSGEDFGGTGGTGTAGDQESQGTNVLAQRLQAPERYTSSVTSEDGVFSLTCDAAVQVPDVEKVSVYRVRQREFTQEWIDTVTNAFFGDAPVYNGTYFNMTKEEALEMLNQLKAWQAEGNLDPYGYIADARAAGAENAEEYYDLQADIDGWEQQYETAAETKERTAVTPGLGNSYYYEDGEKVYQENYFVGAVDLDGQIYKYLLKPDLSSPMWIEILRDKEQPDIYSGSVRWYTRGEDTGNEPDFFPSRETQLELAGITPEEAVKITDPYMEKLGMLGDFSAKAVELSGCTTASPRQDEPQYLDAGWQVTYTRNIDGFPITAEENLGGGLESHDDTTTVPWCYERVTITVNDEGLQCVEIMNLYDVEEQQVENVQMLPFPEIAGIFEQMLKIENSDMTYTKSVNYEIDQVKLGYMRIYDPGADNRSGLLVPVWDFFGRMTDESEYEGETNVSVNARPLNSFLTVNAADGTVVNRSLGY